MFAAVIAALENEESTRLRIIVNGIAWSNRILDCKIRYRIVVVEPDCRRAERQHQIAKSRGRIIRIRN